MADPRHVVLLGEMGAGKTTVGRLLADRLGRPFLDGDVTLEALRGLTAAQIAETGGVAALHADEAMVLRYLLAKDRPSVIGPAASVLEDPASVVALEADDLAVVWLRGSPEVLAVRAATGSHRPDHGPLVAYLAEREAIRGPVLARLADLVLDVDHARPDELVTSIIAFLGTG